MKHKTTIRNPCTLGLLVILTFVLWAGINIQSGVHSSTLQTTIQTKALAGVPQAPRVLVKPQANSPLSVVSIKDDSATPYVPEVEVVVMNKSTQPIRAYTLRYETISTQSRAGGKLLINASSANSVLQSGHTESRIIGDGMKCSDPIRKIIVSIDFVEMTDGSIWGPDVSRSRETLAGQRAGARIIFDRLRKIIKESGPLEVVKLLDEDNEDIMPPPDMSPEWINGFRTGVGSIRTRLKYAYSKNGVGVIESELQKPFDASERK